VLIAGAVVGLVAYAVLNWVSVRVVENPVGPRMVLLTVGVHGVLVQRSTAAQRGRSPHEADTPGR
jgi:peptidoglycan/LPS O-acetylase OafA/YrhL